MKRIILPTIALALVAAACGGSDAGDTTTTLPPISPDDVILEVRFEGGFAPVEFLFSQPPAYTLFGDGRLVFQGPSPAIFPGPLMPALSVVDIGEDGLNEVLQAVLASGLPDITEERNTDAINFVADASDTVITYTDEAGDHIYSVYALGLVEIEDPQLRLLQRIVDTLDTLAFSGDIIGEFAVERVLVIVGEDFGQSDELEATVEPWPFSVAAADVPDFFADLKCFVVDAGDVISVLQAANQLTFFEDGGTTYRIVPRPLLPGEVGCDLPEG